MHSSPLIACPECDLLQQEVALPAGGTVRCRRCGALLYRGHRVSFEITLSFTLAAIPLFLLANIFPIVSLEVQSVSSATTLLGAVKMLSDQGRPLVAGLVFVTTVLIPALQLSAMAYLLLPLHFGRIPRRVAPVLRLVEAVEPWSMVEVFVLGVLVALVRLASLATVAPGLALWSLLGLIVLLSVASASFDPRALWNRLGANYRWQTR